MIYLLHGPDTYRSRGKLREIIDEYRAKGGANLHRFDAEEDDLSPLAGLIGANPLFGGKKLIAIERGLETGREFDLLKRMIESAAGAPDTLVALWEVALEGEARQRLLEIKPLADKAQEFLLLRGAALDKWIGDEAARRGIRLSAPESLMLASRGADLWAITSELDKLAVGGQGGAIGIEGAAESSIFDLGDTFFATPRRALRHLVGVLTYGEEDNRVFAYLANHCRTLLTLKSYLETRRPVPASAKIHPYVIKKASQAVRVLSLNDLRRGLGRFFAEDVKIKTGVAKPAESLFRLLWEK